MAFEQQALRILSSVGERGISIQMLAKNIYNMTTTLFEQPDLKDIHRQVQHFIARNSRSADSLIENAGRRGVYRLNLGSSAHARQLMLEFSDADQQEEPETKKTCQDLSLNLFDES